MVRKNIVIISTFVVFLFLSACRHHRGDIKIDDLANTQTDARTVLSFTTSDMGKLRGELISNEQMPNHFFVTAYVSGGEKVMDHVRFVKHNDTYVFAENNEQRYWEEFQGKPLTFYAHNQPMERVPNGEKTEDSSIEWKARCIFNFPARDENRPTADYSVFDDIDRADDFIVAVAKNKTRADLVNGALPICFIHPLMQFQLNLQLNGFGLAFKSEVTRPEDFSQITIAGMYNKSFLDGKQSITKYKFPNVTTEENSINKGEWQLDPMLSNNSAPVGYGYNYSFSSEKTIPGSNKSENFLPPFFILPHAPVGVDFRTNSKHSPAPYPDESDQTYSGNVAKAIILRDVDLKVVYGTGYNWVKKIRKKEFIAIPYNYDADTSYQGKKLVLTIKLNLNSPVYYYHYFYKFPFGRDWWGEEKKIRDLFK